MTRLTIIDVKRQTIKPNQTMASRSGRRGSISPELKKLISNSTPSSSAAAEDNTKANNNNSDEGCRICGRDEDHAHLLLCEACNDEYHTYCLEPKLECVPDDDWFCGEDSAHSASLFLL